MYPYNCSKAALNMDIMNLDMDIKEDKILLATFNQGQVKIDMGGFNEKLTPRAIVKMMITTMSQMSDKDHGTFVQID